MKDDTSRSRSKFVVAAAGAFLASTTVAQAGPQSALDPYASIAAPSRAGEYQEKKAGGKFGLPMLNKKKAPAAPAADASASNTTFVTGPGIKAKPLKQQQPTQQTKVADAPLAPESKESTKKEGKSGSGMFGGLKALGSKTGDTFKAATSGMVSGSKKVGSGIASGTKATGGAIAKGAGMMGDGIKSASSKAKDGTSSTLGKIAGKGKKSDQSPTQQAHIAGKSGVEDLTTRDAAAPQTAQTPAPSQAQPQSPSNAPDLSRQELATSPEPKSGLMSKFKMPSMKMPKWGKDKTQTAGKEEQLPL